MSPQERNQITVTLSDRAMEEYRLVAKWLNMPVATWKISNLNLIKITGGQYGLYN